MFVRKNWFNYILISRYVEYWIPLVKKQGSFILESVFFSEFKNDRFKCSWIDSKEIENI